jgi:hypothetical protein
MRASMFPSWILGGSVPVGLVGIAVTGWLVVRVWQRGDQARRSEKVFAAIPVAALVFGVIGTLIGLFRAFGAVGNKE